MKERKPLNITALAPPVGRPWAHLWVAEFSNGTMGNFQPELTVGHKGTYLGEVIFQAASGNISVPVTLVVPSASLATFQQFPQLSFTMTTGASNPLPQSLLMDSTGASTSATYVASTGVGGNWLSIQSPCFNCSTPAPISVAINGSALDAGFYVGQVVVSNPTWSMVIPVTRLNIALPGGQTHTFNFARFGPEKGGGLPATNGPAYRCGVQYR
jgi:hypothetical protein